MSLFTPSNPKKRPLLYPDDDDNLHQQRQKRHHRDHDANASANEIQAQSQSQDQIFISSPIHDRDSTFQAHFHPGSSVFPRPGNNSSSTPTSTSSSTTTIVKRLQSHPSFATASHRIVAWRRRSTQQTLQLGSINNGSSTSRNRHVATASGTARDRNSPTSLLPATTSFSVITGSDDDGEKYAGKRLERLLSAMQVEGVIVVARWYGGTMLGPVRFTHMENCATQAVRMWMARLDEDPGRSESEKSGHRLDGGRVATATPTAATATATPNPAEKHRDDEAERARLANQLVERDHSIVVLRGLLAEMTKGKAANTGTADGEQSSSPVPPSTAASTVDAATTSNAAGTVASPAKKLEYSSMPLARLTQLEKARDATIAFILRQLDKVEEAQKASEKDMAAASKEEDHVDGDG
ncbi:hypothetical protein PV04_06788 [Phialophora macrospora]|uniref:Impact N-terminal domain-containing protein n=1 Tax=Phialophora macrospora TaxID=1851006 RepID=A0A0D2G6H2_9EURO|nr:hypothetical protein PV04_06788 [Phialophora macrospora]